MVRSRLPFGVGFQFWDDATPLAYEGQNSSGSIVRQERALARQHRFVVRDKLEYYDIFVAFEDDVLVKGHHVHHYLQLSGEIESLLALASKQLPENNRNADDHRNATKFFGDVTKAQLERLVPGFIRVESVAKEKLRGSRLNGPSNPIDNTSAGTDVHGPLELKVDPTVCCQFSIKPNQRTRSKSAKAPASEDLVASETNIKAFSLRRFPSESKLVDWFGLLTGHGNDARHETTMGGYSSGRKGALNVETKSLDALDGKSKQSALFAYNSAHNFVYV